MIIGMDFGTTNSGMARYDGHDLHLLPLDPANANPRVARTALYVTNDQRVTIGRAAVDGYFSENSGRPVKMQKVWVGEMEVYGADMYYVTDFYTYTDVLSPGRLFLSIKSSLRDPDYLGAVIGASFYPLEDLVAIYLSVTRLRAERLLGESVREAVLGRPVRFATDPQADRLAQERLLAAAFRAGYEKVYLQYEPVAAAYHYALSSNQPQNLLVFDFGGGTLDLTIVRLDGRRHDVLTTGGLPVAGDVFDQKLVRAKFPPHFGEGSVYHSRGQDLPIPHWIYDIFANWQTIIELQTPENLKMLREIAQSARKRRQLEALISLISNNYSLHMFDVAERAKRELSERIGAMMHLEGPGFKVYEMATRTEFETIIHEEIQAIETHLDETVAASGLSPAEIDAVAPTGGSSQIPAFQEMLARKFGRQKLLSLDTFSSVTAGLAIFARAIEEGRVEARAYRPEDAQLVTRRDAGSTVNAVNLKLLQRRLALQESDQADAEGEGAMLVVLDAAGQLTPLALPANLAQTESVVPLEWPNERRPQSVSTVLLCAPDEQLLLVTSQYRFFLITPRQLVDLAKTELTPARFLHFKEKEFVTAAARWPAVKEKSRLLLVTSTGYARPYHLDLLRESIEGPLPLQFNQPPPGWAIALLGAEPADQLLVFLDNGRAARWPVADLPAAGCQAINRRGETVLAALAAGEEDELLLLTAEGYGKRQLAGMIPVPAKANEKGRVQITRPNLRSLALPGEQTTLWALTAGRLIPFMRQKLPLTDKITTKSYPLLELQRYDAPALAILTEAMLEKE